MGAAPVGDRGELGTVDHGARRVRRRGDDEPGERPTGLSGVEQGRRRLVARLGAAVDLDDLTAERGEDVAVGGVARPGESDAVAGLEGCEEGEDEGARRAGGDRDARRVDVEAVPAAVVGRDLRPQLADAERRRVGQSPPGPVDPGRRLRDQARRPARRLTGAERHDVATLGAQHGHPVEHVHDLEGRHLRAPGGLELAGRTDGLRGHPFSLPEPSTPETRRSWGPRRKSAATTLTGARQQC